MSPGPAGPPSARPDPAPGGDADPAPEPAAPAAPEPGAPEPVVPESAAPEPGVPAPAPAVPADPVRAAPTAAARRPRLDADTAAIRAAVRAALPPEPHALIVAVSGGADSMALAAACAHVGRASGHAFTAVTVDHGLQEGSAAIAARAVAAVQALGLPARTVRVDVARTGGPEAAARRARYAALEAARADLGARAVLTAHTLDDQAETVLLGLARGSGARSLAGMRPVAGTVWRPLLGIERAQTRASCAAQGVPVWEDPHNADPAFARVRARRTVLPVLEAELGPGIARALARSAAQLAADSDELEAQAAEALARCAHGARLSPEAAGLPPALRTRVLRAWLRTAGGGGQELGHAHVQRADALLTGARTGAVSVPIARRAVRTPNGGLALLPAPHPR